MFAIGPYTIDAIAVLAPMAGVSDAPFRQLCREFGAGLTTSEMITSDTRLWSTRKSESRLRPVNSDSGIRSIQIAGADPEPMAQAARAAIDHGAQIIDINMGCAAKKVCKKAAGSALLRDELLVRDILEAVVASVDAPVTLKIRTGWDTDSRNAVTIAKLAQDIGIQALAVHGRTRACRFLGAAEYDTIAQVVEAVSIPVIANGDITSAEKAKFVKDYTGASAVMIGRGAQGKPWLFKQINHYHRTGQQLPEPGPAELQRIMLRHVRSLHHFYGDYMGVRIARKHVGWYLQNCKGTEPLRVQFNQLQTATEQLLCLTNEFEAICINGDQAA